MTENPTICLLVLAFIAVIAYLGNRNSNKKTIKKTIEVIQEDNLIVPKKKAWVSADTLAKKYDANLLKHDMSMIE